MNKKAFTLIELLAVIVVLAIVTTIATPRIIDVINNSKKNISAEQKRLVENAAQRYTADTIRTNQNITCVDVTTLREKGYFKDNLTGSVTIDNENNIYEYNVTDSCE